MKIKKKIINRTHFSSHEFEVFVYCSIYTEVPGSNPGQLYTFYIFFLVIVFSFDCLNFDNLSHDDAGFISLSHIFYVLTACGCNKSKFLCDMMWEEGMLFEEIWCDLIFCYLDVLDFTLHSVINKTNKLRFSKKPRIARDRFTTRRLIIVFKFNI